MNKQANIQKAIVLMKSQGMSAEKALKTVYPDWDDAKIQKAAMTIRTMDKTAAVMQVSSAMAELEKTAAPIIPLLGAGAGYMKGKKSDRGLEGAVAGGVGATAGSLAGALAGIPLAALMVKNPPDSVGKIDPAKLVKKNPKALLAALGSVGLGSALGYKKLTKGLDKPKEKKASVGVSLTGLKYASNAMYASHIEKKAGLTKEAIRGLFGPSVGQWATRGAGLGGLAGGGAEIMRLLRMTTPQGRAGVEAAEKALRQAGGSNAKRVMPWQKADAAKGEIGFASSGAKDAAFLKEFDKLQAAGGFGKNPMGYVKLFAPNVLKGAGVGAAAGGALGAGAGAIAKNMAKKQMMEKAKQVAVPAALGLGGLAVLS